MVYSVEFDSDIESSHEGIGMKKFELLHSKVEEDQAESVDSGCVPDDLTSEQLLTDNVSQLMEKEHKFCQKLLQHIKPKSDKEVTKAVKNKKGKKRAKQNHFPSDGFAEDEFNSIAPSMSKKEIFNSFEEPTDAEKMEVSKVEVKSNPKKKKKKNNFPEPATSASTKPQNPQQQKVKKVPHMSKGEEKQKVEEELRLLRKNKSSLNKSQLKSKEKKFLRRIKILDGQIKKEKKISNREEKSALAVRLGLANSVEQANKIYNHCGKIVYSKFDFSSSKKERWADPNSNGAHLNSFLSKLLKDKEKLKEMQTAGKRDKAAKFFETQMWKKAMLKAQGQKVKDDVDLVKKSILRKKQKKQKSKVKWAERERKVQQSKEQRQEKRKQNLETRRERKKKNKKKSKKGKGRKGGSGRTPGF